MRFRVTGNGIDQHRSRVPYRSRGPGGGRVVASIARAEAYMITSDEASSVAASFRQPGVFAWVAVAPPRRGRGITTRRCVALLRDGFRGGLI